MLVHCSAGVGRTGAFIMLDSMMEKLAVEHTINVYEALCNMRAKRVFMIQTMVSLWGPGERRSKWVVWVGAWWMSK